MKIVVVGAGIAGLGVATYLAKRGHEVRVLEASAKVGGRAITYVRAGAGEAHVMRHAAGVPQHSADTTDGALAFLRSADHRSGISFAGNFFSGGYLEPALWSAERAAARIG